VVRLHAVGRKHRLLSSRVFSHKVVGRCERHFLCRVVLQILRLPQVAVALLLSELSVGVLGRLKHGLALGSVVLLSALQDVVVVVGQMVGGQARLLGVLFVKFLLPDLLFNPVFLL